VVVVVEPSAQGRDLEGQVVVGLAVTRRRVPTQLELEVAVGLVATITAYGHLRAEMETLEL
jgi:hypothetical protein